MAGQAAAIPSLDSTMGAMFIGVIIGAALYGVSCLQTWHYFREYPTDPLRTRILVAAVWLTDSAHQVLISHTMYTYVITNFGNPVILGQLVWSLVVEVLINSFTAFLVQSFFTVRIYKLSNKNIFVTGFVFTLVLAQLLVTVVYFVKGTRMSTFAQLTTLKPLSMAVNAMTAATDVVIALALCSLLHQSRTGFRSSDTMINKLIMFSVNTGLLTSLDAVCSLATIAGSPDTFIYICFFFTLGRLYSNSLLATLNARRSLQQTASGHLGNSESLSNQGIPMQRTNVFEPNKTGGNISIKIDTTKELNSDYDSAMDAKRDEHAL